MTPLRLAGANLFGCSSDNVDFNRVSKSSSPVSLRGNRRWSTLDTTGVSSDSRRDPCHAPPRDKHSEAALQLSPRPGAGARVLHSDGTHLEEYSFRLQRSFGRLDILSSSTFFTNPYRPLANARKEDRRVRRSG